MCLRCLKISGVIPLHKTRLPARLCMVSTELVRGFRYSQYNAL